MHAVLIARRKEYLVSLVLNVIGSIGCSLASLLLITVGLGMALKRPVAIAGVPLPLVLFAVLFTVGVVKYAIDSRPDAEEGLDIDNIQSVSTILGNLMVFVNNIVLGSSYCLVRAVIVSRKYVQTRSLDDPATGRFLDRMQDKAREKRYHALGDFRESMACIETLVHHDIIWERMQGGVAQIALNRKYDRTGVV